MMQTLHKQYLRLWLEKNVGCNVFGKGSDGALESVIYCSIVVDLCRVEAPNGMESDSYCLESHDEF